MAPLTRRRKKAQVVALPVIGDTDRLSALPYDVLRQIVGLLPAQDAVQTCLLARTWRDVWKTVDCLRLRFTDEDSLLHVSRFVNPLLDYRLQNLEDAPLSVFELNFNWYEDDEEYCVHRWLYRAMQCEVEALYINILGSDPPFSIDNPLLSCHLKRIALVGVWLTTSFLDFYYCPVLEDLEIGYSCFKFVRQLTSLSLKKLSIRYCSFDTDCRMRIAAPFLVSLWLNCARFAAGSRTPVFDSMPELVVAHVVTGSDGDNCSCNDRMGCHHVMAVGSCSMQEDDEGAERFDSDDDEREDITESVLLDGLSQATDLRLISDYQTYIFRRDLRWCPTFTKLKTLLVNDYWCYPADCRALACILEHAPVLEKVTVVFSIEVYSKYKVEIKGRINPMERSATISEQLRCVEVKCEVLNKRVLDLLKFMSTLNIWFQF